MTTAGNDGDKRSGVTVVGSANIDAVFTVECIPLPGETLIAESTARFPGGKGLNQAVAAARAGAPTSLLGAIGADGDLLIEAMTEAGVRGELIRRVQGPSGQAFIVVDASGENTIIVSSGANATVTDLRRNEIAAISSNGVLLMQLELPLGLIALAAAQARSAGTTVILNAAPARPLPGSLLADTDILVVNEHEACLIADRPDLTTASALLAGLVDRLIVTLGENGSVVYLAGEELARVPARRVPVVDTTGAGDVFCGALASAIAGGDDL
ncbi:MAG TPA: ribokinase, partial [Lacisediminihabitans sp.]|uniref:ribokinase n=1 Tax=Lacisediminihabitans sp. TaxID=2787631 RepID=UPI002ED8B171